MAYRKVYFRMNTYGYRAGWQNDAVRDAFKEESRSLFQSLGWTLHAEQNDSGCCDTVTKGDCELYLHPVAFSGVVSDEDIQVLKDAFMGMNECHCEAVDCYQEYRELSDEEYWAALEARREEIVNAILACCSTKRKTLFVTGAVDQRIAERFSIHRISDKDGSHNLANRYVSEVVEQLVADGRLITAQTRSGQGLRTATEDELQKLDDQIEGQFEMTMGGM